MSAQMRSRAIAITLAACVAVAGCGKSLPRRTPEAGPGPVAAVSAAGAGGLVTKNTTRIGGSSAVVDAAAVARTVYPAPSAATRPQAVVLVDGGDWPAALAASVLAGPPLRAPLLYSEGIALPPASNDALNALRPAGAAALGGAQAIRVGEAAAPPELRLRSVSGGEPAELAVAVERLVSSLRKGNPRQAIVTAYDAPGAMTAPAAGLSAQSGAPILFVSRSAIPRATREELARLGQTSIYVVGPSAVVSEAVVAQLGRFGPVARIGGSDPSQNAIAVARFTDGSFGWGVEEPGHGLVFADASRPFDGPAAASLSASGDYGPLLLLEGPARIPAPLQSYVSDLQPGSPPSGPVHGVYNHGWLIGDERAISAATQAKLDAMLEMSPRTTGAEPSLSTPATPNAP